MLVDNVSDGVELSDVDMVSENVAECEVDSLCVVLMLKVVVNVGVALGESEADIVLEVVAVIEWVMVNSADGEGAEIATEAEVLSVAVCEKLELPLSFVQDKEFVAVGVADDVSVLIHDVLPDML